MKPNRTLFWLTLLILSPFVLWAAGTNDNSVNIPLLLDSYQDGNMTLIEKLSHRINADPFNLVASLIFLCAIIHTFMAGKIAGLAHNIAHAHEKQADQDAQEAREKYHGTITRSVNFKAQILHFLGEVEAIFGIWVLVLFGAMAFYKGSHAPVQYIGGVHFTEPMFVVVIMILAATRPIMQFSEKAMSMIAELGGGSTAAWWFTILTVGPILGSFITEPGAMTISALLLGKQFYEKKPSLFFSYATLGLLFVNISVGGTLSHFAAPPVLMVAGKWNWDFTFMLNNFGWKAVTGILIANLLYFTLFRSEFAKLQERKVSKSEKLHWNDRTDSVPGWVSLAHILFMVWTVYFAHHPPLFIGGFLFFLGFNHATIHHQNRLDLKPALLVGFFLGGLVIHGGLQGWWIAPILSSLGEIPLMIGATILTAFNDNAAITYLSTLVPSFTDGMKYAVVAGAVTGGGLTVIANAPNPAGQSILSKYFKGGVNPLKLALGALIPTLIKGISFMALP